MFMISIYLNLKNSDQYSACTGLNKEEFKTLLSSFSQVYQPKKTNPINGVVPYLTDAGEALFFILYFLKCSPTFQVLGVNFGMSNHSAHNYVDYILPFLKAALKKEKSMPHRIFEDQESFEKAFQNVEDIFIDGTEAPIQRAVNQEVQREDYSGKKKLIL